MHYIDTYLVQLLSTFRLVGVIYVKFLGVNCVNSCILDLFPLDT